MEPTHLEPARAAIAPHDRVREHTAASVNARIDAETAESLRAAEGADRPALLRRLTELDHEWDVDRALMANFAIVGGAAFALGVRSMRRRRGRGNGWLAFFSVQLGLLLGHAIVGWCPPLPVFRRLGFRTQKEIDRERSALVQRLAGADAAAAVPSPS
jgi:hypothetical protein